MSRGMLKKPGVVVAMGGVLMVIPLAVCWWGAKSGNYGLIAGAVTTVLVIFCTTALTLVILLIVDNKEAYPEKIPRGLGYIRITEIDRFQQLTSGQFTDELTHYAPEFRR